MAREAATVASLALPVEAPAAPAGGWRRAWRVGRKRPAAAIGAVIVLLYVAVAAGAPWVAASDPTRTDWGQIRKAPSRAHPFGTDDLGRDGFSRVVWGARISMQAGVFSACRPGSSPATTAARSTSSSCGSPTPGSRFPSSSSPSASSRFSGRRSPTPRWPSASGPRRRTSASRAASCCRPAPRTTCTAPARSGPATFA